MVNLAIVSLLISFIIINLTMVSFVEVNLSIINLAS